MDFKSKSLCSFSINNFKFNLEILLRSQAIKDNKNDNINNSHLGLKQERIKIWTE
jgi:hypothetical protein